MSKSTYDFSTTRLVVHALLLVCSAGGLAIFQILWEVYRYYKK